MDDIDWAVVASDLVHGGASPDEVAGALVDAGASPIDAIKAVRNACGIDLGAAKELVHPKLSVRQQTAAQALWDDAESSIAVDEIAPSDHED